MRRVSRTPMLDPTSMIYEDSNPGTYLSDGTVFLSLLCVLLRTACPVSIPVRRWSCPRGRRPPLRPLGGGGAGELSTAGKGGPVGSEAHYYSEGEQGCPDCRESCGSMPPPTTACTSYWAGSGSTARRQGLRVPRALAQGGFVSRGAPHPARSQERDRFRRALRPASGSPALARIGCAMWVDWISRLPGGILAGARGRCCPGRFAVRARRGGCARLASANAAPDRLSS